MRAIWNHLKSFLEPRVPVATAMLLTTILFASSAKAQTQVMMSQATQVGAYPSAGGIDGGEPSGSTMGVNQQGQVIFGNTYGNDVLELNPVTGVVTTLGAQGNVGAVAVDAQNNYYFTNLYGPTIVKIPYVSGAYAAFNTNSLPACTGNDTAACTVPGLTTGANGYWFGVLSLTFDAAGDMFFGLSNGNTAPNAIFECNAACTKGSGSATLLFKEPTNSTSQLVLGGLATDSYGNLFFTDSAQNSVGSTASNVNELVYTAGTGYAATPVALYSYTPPVVKAGDDQIDAVNVDANGVVYFATTYAGIFAFPSTGGVVNAAGMYAVSTQGAKVMATNGTGYFYVDTSASTGDVIVQVSVGNLAAPSANTGSSSTATGVSTLLNDGACTSSSVSFVATESGTNTSEFTANTTGNTCTALLTKFGSFPTNVTFTPAAGGTRTATLNATDSIGGTGTATITGQGVATTVATPTFSPVAGTFTSTQTVTISDATSGAAIYYTTNGTTPTTGSTLYTAPIHVNSTETIEAMATAAGLTNSSVASATYTINLTVATPTISPTGGTYTSAQTVSIAEATTGAVVYYTTDGTTPTASSNLYTAPFTLSSSKTIKAIGIETGYASSTVASAAYTIIPTLAYPAIVMSQVTQVGAYPSAAGGIDGGEPSGSTMGVNQQGQVIFGNTYGNDVLELNPVTGVVTTLGAPGNVGAVAVDAQNNYYFTSLYGTTIVKIPYVSGAYAAFSASSLPACTGNDTAACSVPGLANGANGYYFGVLSLTFDAAGDMFFGLTNGNHAPNAIFECNAACTKGTGSATLLYQEPTNSTSQLVLGGLATDSYGNLFFTDSAQNSVGSTGSNVNELVYTAGTGYAATPVVLYSYTPPVVKASDDQIDAVSVDANGVVYFATTFAGIFAFPSSGGVVNAAGMYAVSTQGAKVMATDGKGNFFVDNNISTGDVMDQVSIGNLSVPTASLGSSSSATNVTTILNDGPCSGTPTATFAATESGTATTEFTAATTGTCTAATLGTSATFATTVTFTPTATGTRTAVLTATDWLGYTGTANVTGAGSAQPAAAAPTFSVAGGTYTTVQKVTISDATTGAAIYYTTNGTTPTTASTLYSGPITVSANETIEAITTATGYTNSSVSTAVYVINLPTAVTPTFSPAPGTYTSTQSVTIADTTSGAAIYYTTDGSTPTTSSTLYSGAITVATTETINALAVASGYNNSTVGSGLFTINPPAATPAFSVAAGSYFTVQPVTITDATTGASIYYTLDGTAPTTSSTLYTGAISVGKPETLKAVAIAPNYSISAVASAAYVITLPAATPTFATVGGTYTTIQTVTISTTTPSATIYYTTNGTAPTTSSAVYSVPLTVGVSETIEAIATATGSTTSAVGTAVYVINLPAAATPTFSPAAATFATTQSVTITDTTPGAKIYYTTDGTVPTTSSTLYTGAISVGVTQTIEAMAIGTGYNASAVATGKFTITPNMTLAINPTTLTVKAGQSGTAAVSVTPLYGLSSNVSFACTGLPSDAGCSFSPVNLNVAGGTVSTTTLTVSTFNSSAALRQGASPLLPGAGVMAALCLLIFGRRRRLKALLAITLSVVGLGLVSGCANSSSSMISHTPTSSVVTVTATAGTVQGTATFTLNVQ